MIEREEFATPTARLFGIFGFTVLVVIVLVWRWVDLQVEQFSHFSELAHENQVKLLPIEPPRGFIYDRNGVKLAANKTVYSINVESDFAGDVLGKIDSLTTAIEIPDRAIKALRDSLNQSVYKGRIVLKEQLTEAEVIRFLDIQFLFPEILLGADLVRYYPFENAAGHVLGYVGRINESDKERLRKEKLTRAYSGAKFIGKTGVELIHESRLRGGVGIQEAQVDAHGRIIFSKVIRQPDPGKDVHLTIDWRLQQLAEELLAGESGAAVVLDVRNGELLALASSPRFDGNHFIFGISQTRWDALIEADGKPLIHRAIYGQYAPGSTVKPFLALSALERGWRDINYSYHSKGTFQLTQKHVFHDWKKGGHGRVGFSQSIIRSVNTFYYQLGHDVGIEDIHDALALFGFGETSNIDLDNEKGGVLPSPSWKEKTIGEIWYPGDTIAASVGQGYFQVTPLQMARAMAVIANGGKRVHPHLFTTSGSTEAVAFDSRYLSLVQAALAKVTQPGGTASRLGRNNPYGIAGKTGTAQVSRLQLDESGERIKNKDLPKHLRDHAWFVGYAPVEEPEVAVAVIVEHGGSGGATAGPIVRELMDHQFAALIQAAEAAKESEAEAAPAAENNNENNDSNASESESENNSGNSSNNTNASEAESESDNNSTDEDESIDNNNNNGNSTSASIYTSGGGHGA